MISTCRALILDGWTKNGTYYFGVIESYMESLKRVSNGELNAKLKLALPLLSVSSLAPRDEDENVIESKAMTPNTETHIRHIEDVLTPYHLNVYECTTCLIANSCNLNLRIARSLELPHVGCSSHKLNLEVMKMIENSNYI